MFTISSFPLNLDVLWSQVSSVFDKMSTTATRMILRKLLCVLSSSTCNCWAQECEKSWATKTKFWKSNQFYPLKLKMIKNLQVSLLRGVNNIFVPIFDAIQWIFRVFVPQFPVFVFSANEAHIFECVGSSLNKIKCADVAAFSFIHFYLKVELIQPFLNSLIFAVLFLHVTEHSRLLLKFEQLSQQGPL